MRSVLKKVLIVISVSVGIFLIWWMAEAGYSAWGNYKWQKQTAAFQAKLEQPYKEDTYGGQTPEETWGMFLDALKKGDINLASKYYDVGHQEKAKQMIEELKQKSNLDNWIKELGELKKSSRESLEGEANYYYDYFDEEFKQILSASVIFYLNPYTKIWKIIY